MSVLGILRNIRPTASITAIRCSFVTLARQPKTKIPPALMATQLRQFVTSKVLAGGGGGDRTFVITPSRYSWNKYKDQLHFYVMLGLIPGLALVFFVNVFIGPATLKPIPEGYVPKEHEYHWHPITRFMMKYLFTGHQQDYERNLFYAAEVEEIKQMKILDRRVEELMAYYGDYPNYYTSPTLEGRYFRWSSELMDESNRNSGSDITDTSDPGNYDK